MPRSRTQTDLFDLDEIAPDYYSRYQKTAAGSRETDIVTIVDDVKGLILSRRHADEFNSLVPNDVRLVISHNFDQSLSKGFKWMEALTKILEVEEFQGFTNPSGSTSIRGVYNNPETGVVGLVQFYFEEQSRTNRMYVDINTNTSENLKLLIEWCKSFYAGFEDDTKLVNIQWFSYKDVYELKDDFNQTILDECYPQLGMPVSEFLKKFRDSKERLTIFKGPPGTGKTSLIRYLCNNLCDCRYDQILYASDAEVIAKDNMFISFATDPNAKVMVLEDIDLHLTSRADGNTFMYKLLGASDGLIRNSQKKIIISTNIPNIREIDSALIRDGRCFGIFNIDKLTYEQSLIALRAMGKESLIETLPKGQYTIAELYSL